MERPKKYKAKDLQGKWVKGWYVELHAPHYDNDIPDRVVGYDIIPSIFTDEEGERGKGGYWHTINPTTLQEINETMNTPLCYECLYYAHDIVSNARCANPEKKEHNAPIISPYDKACKDFKPKQLKP